MFWNKKTINTEMIHFVNYAMNDIYSSFNETIPIIIFIVQCICIPFMDRCWYWWLKHKTAQCARGFSIEKPSRWGLSGYNTESIIMDHSTWVTCLECLTSLLAHYLKTIVDFEKEYAHCSRYERPNVWFLYYTPLYIKSVPCHPSFLYSFLFI